MLTRVKDNGETSATFSVSNGVKQGFVLDPTLLTDTFSDSDVGIGIRKRYDGSLFNHRRRQTETRVSTDTNNFFLFADETPTLNPTSPSADKDLT